MKNTNHKVSVVIPFYSRVDWLIEAVESVFNQTYKNFKIIVVNDGSKEDVSEFIKQYKEKITYILKENGGPGSARNTGINKATGEYIAFLDSDDIWHDNKLEKQVDLMEKTAATWSHTGYSLFLDSILCKEYKQIDVSHYRGNVFPKCLLSSPIATPCVMVKNLYLKENITVRFSEKMRYGQDGYMWLNLSVNNSLEVVPDVLTKVRIRDNNAANRTRVHLKTKAQLWEHIKHNRTRYFRKGNVDYFIRTSYTMCFYANNIIEALEKKHFFNNKLSDILSGLLYAFPYVILKVYYNVVWKNKRTF